MRLKPQSIEQGINEAVVEELSKSLSPQEISQLQNVETEGPKSFFIDPQLAFDMVGYVRRQKPLTSSLLREIAYRDKVVAAIIQLRKNQIKNFTKRYHQRKNESGWKVCLRDSEKRPTAGDKKRIDEVAWFIEHMGFNPAEVSDGPKRDHFSMFVDKIIEDSLILDAAAFERVFDYAGNLAEVYAVDGGTIRYIHREIEGTAQAIRFAQEWQGQILAYFTDDELAYCVRNPRSDIRTMGYGFSEIEKLIETITSHLFSEQWNARFFNQGAIPQGVLSISGNMSQETLEAFKRNWLVQVSGVQNAWRVPVIGVPEGRGVQWIPFHQTQRDMEFHEWMRYLIALISAVFQCDPSEIGFETYRGGQSDTALFEARGEYKLTASQDKGLFPLMQWLADVINQEIIHYIYPDLVFQWVGLRDKSEREALEFQQMELNMGKRTVNEIRAMEDLPPIDEDWANAPANPTLAQVFMAKYNMDMQEKMMQEQQAQMAAQGPPPGAPPPEGEPPAGPPPPTQEDAQGLVQGMNNLAETAS